MENPFSFKVGQVFTGFGIGCGIGIGFGRPIYFGELLVWILNQSSLFSLILLHWIIHIRGLWVKISATMPVNLLQSTMRGAIPVLQPVLSATRGATDALSGVGKHFNDSLKKLGMKKIEAGVGCGVGIGHGFGVGVALKPWVFQRFQTSITESVMKIVINTGIESSLSSVKNLIPASTQSDILARKLQAPAGGPLDPSKTILSTFQHSKSDGTIHREIQSNIFGQKDTFSSAPLVSRTEKLVDNFLQSSAFKNEVEIEQDEAARNLRTQNNLLQLLLKHQEIIDKLMEENQKMHKVLIEDLRIPLYKLQASSVTNSTISYPCIYCFECRRRNRKLKA